MLALLLASSCALTPAGRQLNHESVPPNLRMPYRFALRSLPDELNLGFEAELLGRPGENGEKREREGRRGEARAGPPAPAGPFALL